MMIVLDRINSDQISYEATGAVQVGLLCMSSLRHHFIRVAESIQLRTRYLPQTACRGEGVKSDTQTERTATNDGRLHIDFILPRGVILGHRSEFIYICYSLNR